MAQPSGSQSKILTESGTNELEIITFFLQWQDPATGRTTKTFYGINAAKVRELVAMPAKVTVTPEAPECVEGVFLLRDRTISLTNLCKWFNYQPDLTPEALAKWVVVVAEINGKPFGFITHGVDKVHRVSWTKVLPPPGILAGCQSITGVCLMDDQVIQMVDFEKIAAAIDPAMALDRIVTSQRLEPASGEEDKVVVIADDSSSIRMQMVKTLERAGLKVVAHNDGQAAWEYLEHLREAGTVDDRVLAVVTDIEMPRMDGHHLCLKIKEQQAYEKIPVLLFSSMISDGLRNKGEAVGADDQITKPELNILFERLQACLDRKKSR
ncbi:MAG: chemotaxis protein [Desulfobulbaceae bacterium]|nr:chemotaxis protein [Desulfobulbaceae bacterium]